MTNVNRSITNKRMSKLKPKRAILTHVVGVRLTQEENREVLKLMKENNLKAGDVLRQLIDLGLAALNQKPTQARAR